MLPVENILRNSYICVVNDLCISPSFFGEQKNWKLSEESQTAVQSHFDQLNKNFENFWKDTDISMVDFFEDNTSIQGLITAVVLVSKEKFENKTMAVESLA